MLKLKEENKKHFKRERMLLMKQYISSFKAKHKNFQSNKSQTPKYNDLTALTIFRSLSKRTIKTLRNKKIVLNVSLKRNRIAIR